MSDLNVVLIGPLTAANVTAVMNGNSAATSPITLDSINIVELPGLLSTDIFN